MIVSVDKGPRLCSNVIHIHNFIFVQVGIPSIQSKSPMDIATHRMLLKIKQASKSLFLGKILIEGYYYNDVDDLQLGKNR